MILGFIIIREVEEMPRFPYTPPGNKLGRQFREQWKQNLIDIEHDIKELNGAQLDALEAADYANNRGKYADERGKYANTQGNYAGNQGDYAKDAADNAIASTNTFRDENTNKTYNWGLKQTGEHMIFMFEEV